MEKNDDLSDVSAKQMLDAILNATPRRHVKATCGCWLPLDCPQHGATEPVHPQPDLLQPHQE